MDQQLWDDWLGRVYNAFGIARWDKEVLADAIGAQVPDLGQVATMGSPMRRWLIEAVIQGVPRAAVAGRLNEGMLKDAASGELAVEAILSHIVFPSKVSEPVGGDLRNPMKPAAVTIWSAMTKGVAEASG